MKTQNAQHTHENATIGAMLDSERIMSPGRKTDFGKRGCERRRATAGASPALVTGPASLQFSLRAAVAA